MSEMKIAVRKQPAEYAPGEEIAGGVQWQLDRAPESVEARLLWHAVSSGGRGYEDVGVVATVRFDGPGQEDTRSFQFTAPLAPYSFAGKLVTLTWAVEVVALPRKENTRVEVVIAPGGKALELAEVGRDQGGAAG
jgi:hypothetical protein